MQFINKSDFSIRMRKIVGRAEDQEYEIERDLTFCKDASKISDLRTEAAKIAEIKLELVDAARAEADGAVSPEQQKILDDVELAYKIQEMKLNDVERYGVKPPPTAISTDHSLFEIDPSWNFSVASARATCDSQIGPSGEFTLG